MSNQRSTFILAGGGLLTLAILGISAREFQLGPFAEPLAGWAPMVAYGTFGAAALLGGLLLLFAPSTRRVERRVRLDRPDAQNPVMARPAAAGSPTTVGMVAHAQKPTPRPKTDRSADTTPAHAMPAGGATGTTAQQRRPAAWAHPNDIVDDGASEPMAAAASPATGRSEQDTEDREALRARLAELDRQANHAKVRYGLGQLSGNGYRQVLAKLDEARAEIEETLLGSMEA